MVVTTRGISVMKLEEVDAQLRELGWKHDPGVKLTLLEKRNVLRERLEKLPVANKADLGSQQSGHSSLDVYAEADRRLQELAELVLQNREASAASSAIAPAAPALRPATMSAPRDNEKDREQEGEQLERKIDQIKSQLSDRRFKMVARDIGTPDTGNSRGQ